jgi:hypothetical protein
MKKKVLVLVFSNLKHDARVSRQVSFLAKHFLVSLVCFDTEEIENVTPIRITQTKLSLVRKALLSTFLLLRFHSIAYRLLHEYQQTLEKRLAGKTFDLIIANDIDTLPLAFHFKGTSAAKIIFDAHEYAPRHFEDKLAWRIFFQPLYTFLCTTLIPKVDAMLTVGRGLAEEYEKHFHVRPTILTNAARYHDINPSPVKEGRIRLIHHGIANPSRRLELMIEMMGHLDQRFTLDLMLMTSNYASAQTRTYIENLKSNAEKDTRIKILPSVPSKDVVKTINQYDMGVFLLPPINFNYANTLPNKLFDFIQARLAIAVGPTPEMASIVNQYKNGVVSTDFTAKSLADKLNSMSQEELIQFKNNSTVAATKLNAEENEKIFMNLLQQLL